MNVAIVIAMKTVEVLGHADTGIEASFFDSVDVIFLSLIRQIFIVVLDPGCSVGKIFWENCL